MEHLLILFSSLRQYFDSANFWSVGKIPMEAEENDVFMTATRLFGGTDTQKPYERQYVGSGSFSEN